MIKLKDIIKESKRLNLFEQEAINLPPVNFDKAFVNNYTEIEPGSWEKTANQLIATLKDYRDKVYSDKTGKLLKKHLNQVDNDIQDDSLRTLIKKCLTSRRGQYRIIQRKFEEVIG